MSVDGENAYEIDDVFSLEQVDSKHTYLHIGLANPAVSIAPTSVIYYRAKELLSSKYHPRYIAMLDEALVSNRYSLDPGELRQGLILTLPIDLERQVFYPAYIRLGEIKNHQKITYQQVNQWLLLPNRFNHRADIFRLALTLALYARYQRLKLAKQLYIDWNERLVLLDNGKIKSLPDLNQASHLMIEEFMVLANRQLAQFAQVHHIPLLYRSCQRIKGEFRAFYSPIWQPHAPLGIDSYTHITSPLRRFADLVNGYQINAYLDKPEKPDYVFTESDLKLLAQYLNQRYRPSYSDIVA